MSKLLSIIEDIAFIGRQTDRLQTRERGREGETETERWRQIEKERKMIKCTYTLYKYEHKYI